LDWKGRSLIQADALFIGNHSGSGKRALFEFFVHRPTHPALPPPEMAMQSRGSIG
jgi:hypothetical protein